MRTQRVDYDPDVLAPMQQPDSRCGDSVFGACSDQDELVCQQFAQQSVDRRLDP